MLKIIAVSICKLQSSTSEPVIKIVTPIHDAHSLYLQQARPYLEGIRLINGADIIIAEPECFENISLNNQLYNSSELSKLLPESCKSQQIYETYMLPKQFKNLINYRLRESVCSANDSINTVVYGAYLDYDQSDCIINQLFTCTWYESTSMHCRRWSQMTEQPVKVAFTPSYIEQIQYLFQLNITKSEFTLQQAAERFVPHYDGHHFSNFAENWRSKTFLSSKLNYVVAVFLVVSVYQTIKSFYSEEEVQEDDVLDVFQDDDDYERRFAKMTRRQIIEMLAGTRQVYQQNQ